MGLFRRVTDTGDLHQYRAALGAANEALEAQGIEIQLAGWRHVYGEIHVAVVCPGEGDLHDALDRLPGPGPIQTALDTALAFAGKEVVASYQNERTWRSAVREGGWTLAGGEASQAANIEADRHSNVAGPPDWALAQDPEFTGQSDRFLRVWNATYEVDAATSTHLGRTVSGESVEEVFAKAQRRTPSGARLVYIARQDDFEAVWRANGGWTPAANELHVFKPLSPRLFKDLQLGDRFRRGYGSEFPLSEKIDDEHALVVATSHAFEIDPYDGAYPA